MNESSIKSFIWDSVMRITSGEWMWAKVSRAFILFIIERGSMTEMRKMGESFRTSCTKGVSGGRGSSRAGHYKVIGVAYWVEGRKVS